MQTGKRKSSELENSEKNVPDESLSGEAQSKKPRRCTSPHFNDGKTKFNEGKTKAHGGGMTVDRVVATSIMRFLREHCILWSPQDDSRTFDSLHIPQQHVLLERYFQQPYAVKHKNVSIQAFTHVIKAIWTAMGATEQQVNRYRRKNKGSAMFGISLKDLPPTSATTNTDAQPKCSSAPATLKPIVQLLRAMSDDQSDSAAPTVRSTGEEPTKKKNQKYVVSLYLPFCKACHGWQSELSRRPDCVVLRLRGRFEQSTTLSPAIAKALSVQPDIAFMQEPFDSLVDVQIALPPDVDVNQAVRAVVVDVGVLIPLSVLPS